MRPRIHECLRAPHRYEAIPAWEVLEGRSWTSSPADVVLVDWSADFVGVYPVLRELLRAHTAPLIAVCGPSPAEHVAALAIGADYVESLPLSSVSLEARLLAYHRRVHSPPVPLLGPSASDGADGDGLSSFDAFDVRPARPSPSEAPKAKAHAREFDDGDLQTLGALTLDHSAHCFLVRGDHVPLTDTEYRLLAFMMERAGACCERDLLLDHVWGLDFNPGTNVIDFHISQLRRKLRPFGLDVAIITIRGRGFRLDLP